MSGAWSQLESLLTCCICLDRYRSPKLLPCQHSFCEPCLDGLVDYGRRQIKCPKCRAEHRLPYSGDPNFPVNFTLMRFLELYQRLTGEEVEPLPSMLERCVICSEKAEVSQCAHCDKKVCEECKNAHIQVMQRELQRLNAQTRRALARFNEELGQLKKCDDKLRIGCEQARTSIVELAAGLIGLIKEKEKQLLKELDDFQHSEEANLAKLKEGVDDEYSNLVANCELIEKNVLNTSSIKSANQSNINLNTLEYEEDSSEMMHWSDLELVEYREIFLKTLDLLRNFEAIDSTEYSRSGLKLDVIKDLDSVRKQVANYATLKIQYLATEKLQQQQQMVAQLAAGIPLGQTTGGSPNYAQQLGSTHALNQSGSSQLNVPLNQSILMRSQSDHRLATQFAKKELLQKQQAGNPKYGTSNYAAEHSDLNNQYGSSHYAPGQTGTQYRSRFMREKNAELSAMHDSDDAYDPYAAHRVRFDEQPVGGQLTASQLATQLQNAFKVFDTKEANRCPLSSVVKLNDSMHFMERIEENKRKAKKLEKEKAEMKAMSQPPATQTTNPTQTQPLNQTSSLTNRQSPIQPGNLTTNQQQQAVQNKAPPPNRQLSEDEIDKQKRLNKQFELQTLTNNLRDVNTAAVNTTSTPVQLTSQQPTPTQQQPKQQLHKQNSIHGPEPSIQSTQSQLNALVNKNLLTAEQQRRLNQTSSGPDDEEDEEVDEESGEEDSDEDEDDAALPGNTRQVISASNKLSGQQRPSFEESESKLMPVSALTSSTQRLLNSFDQPQQQSSVNGLANSGLMNMSRTSSIDRDYVPSTTTATGYTSSGNKLSRQNSANSSSANQTSSNIGTTSSFTPRNSIDVGSTGYSGSRSGSFDRDNGTGYRYLTRANTRLDDLLNRDSYTNDNSSSSSSNHNRFNRFNRLARSSTVSSLSPSYTTTNTTANSTSGSNTSGGGSSNYRTYDLDSGTGSNYLTGTSGYSSRSSADTGGNSSYLSIRSRPSSPPPQTRTSSTNASGLSRYGIGNSSVGTSSSYRRPSAYQPDTNEEEPRNSSRAHRKTLNGLLDEEERSLSLDCRLLSDNSSQTTSINYKKQHSLESNVRSRKKIENEEKKVRKSRTTGLYLASNLNRETTFDYSDKSSSDEEEVGVSSNNGDKLLDKTDQILHKQRLEQRINLYKSKGTVKLCIGNEDGFKFKWPKDVCWAKFTNKTKLVGQQVIIVCDSGNDRIHIFSTQGTLIHTFTTNCPTSVCCYSDGTLVVSDTNQHRLQWFDSSGNFLKLLGSKQSDEQLTSSESQSTAFPATSESTTSMPNLIPNSNTEQKSLQRQTSAEPGQFSSPYGLAYEKSLNELYVCDKGNQRVQILDADSGLFKRFLGSISNRSSSSSLNTVIKLLLKSPNFVHSNGKRVVVSDTNSHCVHVLNIKNSRNEKLMLGGEGTSSSKFKYPRGVSIDEFNFTIVADSGNNRIQIFNPDGSFLKSFGSWGSGDGQFKGIEGISVDELGDIYVCDRENNRVLVF